MNKSLKAGRPSASKKQLSIADVSEPVRIKLKRISFDMPESNHRELKKYAAERGITIREVLNGLIENLLSQEKK